MREGLNVEAFMPTENALYFTSHTTPGQVWLWRDDAWLPKCETEPMHWVSPWMDFGCGSSTKGGFALYVTVECEHPCRITFSVETEKKLKRKTVTFLPGAEGRKPRQKRIPFGGYGKGLRIHIDSDGDVPWRMIGGMVVEAEPED